MWRVGLGVIGAVGMALVVLYALNLWPFEPPRVEATSRSPNNGASLSEPPESLADTPAHPRRIVFVPSGIPVLHDPITILDTTISLIEEQDASIKIEYGQIFDIPVRLGQRVIAGQQLAQVDDAVARRQADLYGYKAQSTAKPQAAKLTYNAANEIARQSEKSRESRSVAEKDALIDQLNKQRTYFDWVTAYEETEVAKREYLLRLQELENHRVLSKIDGEITQINKRIGESIRQGEVLFHIVNYDRLRAEGAPKVENRSSIQVGMRAVVEPELEKRCVKELRGHTGAIRGLAVTPDGRYLASASEDGSVIIWNPVTGRQIEMLRDELGGEATAIACSPMTVAGQSDRERIYSFVAGYNDGNARLWRIQISADGAINKDKPIELPTSASGHRGAIRAVAFSAKGDRCATGGEDRQICVWNVEDGKFLYWVTGNKEGRGSAHRGIVTCLHFTPDDHLVSAATDKTLKKWKLGATGADLVLRKTNRVGDVEHLGMTADGTRALFDLGDELWILDLETSEILGRLQSRRGAFERLALFSPSGRIVLTKTSDGRLQLLDAPATVDEAAFFRAGYTHGFRRNSLLTLAALTANLTPSGQVLFPAIAGTGAPQPTKPQPPEVTPFVPPVLTSAATMFPLWTIVPHDFRGMTAVPELWTLNGSEIRHLTIADATTVTCGAFSPDESHAFTAGTDKIIRVWEMPSTAELRQPLEAMVTFVGNQVESGTSLVRVRAEFENPSDSARRLMPGTRVNLTLYPESATKPAEVSRTALKQPAVIDDFGRRSK